MKKVNYNSKIAGSAAVRKTAISQTVRRKYES